MRRRFGTPEEEDNIDLTPMLDVVFIMLIFFIVTASFIKESGLSVTRPDQNQPPPPEDNE
ncbi:MAG: biopolymer transporter ExbD, partial [Pseudomonadota bacterium]